MATPEYQLLYMTHSSQNKTLQYIYHEQSGLKIIIWPLITNPTFSAGADEMCFYAQVDKWWYAFETAGIKDHQHDLVSPALDWFATRMNAPHMMPQLMDPRATFPIRNDIN